MADNTSHRKKLFFAAHLFWLVVVCFQLILVSDSTPPQSYLVAFIVLTVLASLGVELAIVLIVSYLPEVSETKEDVTALTGRTYAYINTMQLGLALIVTAIGLAFSINDDDDAAFTLMKIAAAFVVANWLYFTIPGIMLLDERVKENTDSPLRSLILLKKTFGEIVTKYPQVGIYFSSYTFFYAGVTNMISLAAQFLLSYVGLTAFEVSVMSALLLVSAVFGALP